MYEWLRLIQSTKNNFVRFELARRNKTKVLKTETVKFVAAWLRNVVKSLNVATQNVIGKARVVK
jgi:hypothetical protein